jgi:hypothetical protein
MGSAQAALRELQASDELLAAGDTEASAAARERAHGLLHALGLTTAVFDGDAEVWIFGHEAVGPAGPATLRLAGGTTLSVDLADPSYLLSLTAPVSGDGAFAETVRMIVGSVIGETAATMLDADAAPGMSALVQSEGAATQTFRALARLAVLDRARKLDEDEHGAWPLWAAEAAVLCARAAAVPGCDIRARAEAATCAQTVMAVAEAGHAAAAHDRLAALLPELRRLAASEADRALLDRAARALSQDDRRLDRDWRERIRGFVAGLEASVPRLPRLLWTSELVTRSPGSTTPAPRPRPSATFVISPYFERFGLSSRRRALVYWSEATGELDVRCRTTRDGSSLVGALWVRAFMAPDLEFFDSAQLALDPDERPDEEGRGLARARLALPQGLSQDQILIDITVQPAEPPAESRLGLLRRATDAGEAAATAERARLYIEAVGLWAKSAELWRRAGAELQASMAELFKAQALDRRPGAGGDDLRDELAQRMPASAWRISHERADQEPFLGELTRPDDAATG